MKSSRIGTSMIIVGAVVLLTVIGAAGQSRAVWFAQHQEDLHDVVPQAESFSPEEGLYRHFRGYAAGEGDEKKLVGFAFLNNELGARAWGYSGEIQILVGLDLRGRLTGVKVLQHFEPYGFRSIDLPEYREQFEGKSVLEPFEVGEDIDGYSGATITTLAATRSIRHAARRMAKEFLTKKAVDEE
jgi:NosR/NirI family nitrous oxide reductase transcriptional regulator